MRVRVESIVQGSPLVVTFSSEFGSSMACWVGEEPTVHSWYDVEVDIMGEMEWNQNVFLSENLVASISSSLAGTRLSGFVESVDDDDCTVLRLGDHIILVTVHGIPNQAGIWVCIDTKELFLYPFCL